MLNQIDCFWQDRRKKLINQQSFCMHVRSLLNVKTFYRKIYCGQNIQVQKKTQKIHQIKKKNNFQKQQTHRNL